MKKMVNGCVLLSVLAFLAGFFLALPPEVGPFPIDTASCLADETDRAGEEPAPDPIKAALRDWTAQRTHPHDEFPADGLTRAFEHTRRTMREYPVSHSGNKANLTCWTAMGPDNIAGRMLTVVLNPQNPSTVWAGSAACGLWRSSTGGVGPAAWQNVSTGFPVLAVSCIAIDPADTNVMYIGTGEVYNAGDTHGGLSEIQTLGSYGMGILKTTDGGLTWTKSLDWSVQQERGVWDIAIHPQNHDILWAGTTEGTYKSMNAGTSWFLVNSTSMVTDVAIKPDNGATVFIACGNFGSAGSGVYRTVNGGGSWVQMTHFQVIPQEFYGKAQLSICESFPNTVYISFGHGGDPTFNASWLVRSIDAGDNWTLQTTIWDYAWKHGWFSHDVAAHPDIQNEVLVVGIDIWHSTNAGVTLNQMTDFAQGYTGQVPAGGPEGPANYSHADHHDIVYHPTNSNIVYVANGGGIFRSTNGGTSWAGCNGGLQTGQFFPRFATSPNDSNLAFGGLLDNASAKYTGTASWTKMREGDGGSAAIDHHDDRDIYASSRYLTISKTTNGGLSWFDVSPPTAGNTAFIGPFAMGGPAENEVMYAGRGYVLKSVTGGANWLPINFSSYMHGNPAAAIAVSQTNSDVVYVTSAPVETRSNIFRTLDGGASWTNITSYPMPNRYLIGIAIHPADDATVYVTASGYGSGHLYRSTNSGDDWVDISGGLPDVPTSCVLLDPLAPDHIYLGTDLGVFISTDGGTTWYTFNAGLPDAVMVMDLTISPQNRMLRVATHGAGVWERKLYLDTVDVPEGSAEAVRFRLNQNHPNPFNPQTSIRYYLADESNVRLELFDAAGRLVRTLVAERQSPGEYAAAWNGQDHQGRAVASGVYLYRLRVGDRTETRQMMLVR